MTPLFLASDSDRDAIEAVRSNLKGSRAICVSTLADVGPGTGDEFDTLVIVISPAGNTSTAFQGVALDTLATTVGRRRMRLRLENAKVPVGFGAVCDLEDWTL